MFLIQKERFSKDRYYGNLGSRQSSNDSCITSKWVCGHTGNQETAEIVEEMKRHETADENFYVTANMVMKLASQARELFESSEVEEKRQLLNFVFQNLKLDEKTLLITAHIPFLAMMQYKQCPMNWRWRDKFETFDWASIQNESLFQAFNESMALVG